MKKHSRMMIIVFTIFAVSLCIGEPEPETPHLQKTFDGKSTELKYTKIVPTLETKIEVGYNAVWCSSFLAAWKSLANNIAQSDISLEDSPQAAALLNKSDDPTTHIPAGSIYVATGWVHKGVIEKIREELKEIFPEKKPPIFPGIVSNSFVAYSYLEASIKFPLPYFQFNFPLEFTDSSNRKTKVTSFGIRPKDGHAYKNLRDQTRVLFIKVGSSINNLEFAVDLCADSSPSQIIVASINQEPSLSMALEKIEKEIQMFNLKNKGTNCTIDLSSSISNNILLVPDFFWQISHHFEDLEGKLFLNPKLSRQRLDVARQDILFRLNRGGAELKSEAIMHYCFKLSPPTRPKLG